MQLERAFAWSSLAQLKNEQLVSILLNVPAGDAEAYTKLAEKPHTVKELSSALEKERSIAQRCLKRLVDAGLAQRVSRPAKRGRRFEYEAAPIGEVKRRLAERLDAWHGAIRQRVQEL